MSTKETTISTKAPADGDQAAHWNGAGGRAWVDEQETLDGLFEPFEDQLVAAVRAEGARRVLDVGCGTGATTLAIARALGATGTCTGVDFSEPMLAYARARAESARVPASFILADAETHPFAPGGYDMIVSRFGVLFFTDAVRAFTNLRRAAGDGAALRLLAWRSPDQNPFMTAAERAAAPLLPNKLPPRLRDAPGQFAFADATRVERILVQGGWADVDIQALDVPLAFPEASLAGYLAHLGPLGRALAGEDEPTRTRIVDTVRRAFDPFVHGDEVRFDAACWLIRARK
jgi:SAM-dependent methyltransferase